MPSYLSSLSSSLNPIDWVSPEGKLSHAEVCAKYHVDIINDELLAFWWNILTTNKIIACDNFLTLCGYTSSKASKRASFVSLVRKNNIPYTEVDSTDSVNIKYLCIETSSFEYLLMQMRGAAVKNTRKIYFFLKNIYTQYIIYENYYEKYCNRQLLLSLSTVNSNKDLISGAYSQILLKIEQFKNNITGILNSDREIIINTLKKELNVLDDGIKKLVKK
ncbi:MAG: MSV199 domain-containing protein [Cotesia congregata filamentous virus 2]